MLSHLVIAAQVLELAAWFAACMWLLGLRPLAALGAAVVAAFAARLVITALSFLVSWLYRSPREASQQLGLSASLALLIREWWALAAYNLAYLPWERLLVRRDPEPKPAAAPAIVLVHGFLANRGCFHALARNLEARGLGPVHIPNLRSWLAPIERFEETLEAEVERIAKATGQPVMLVAHSMGGLASRLYLARHGTARVAKLITIASPHHGTALAPFGFGPNAAQMRRGSAFLRELGAKEGEAGPGLPATSIYSVHDNLVSPQDTSRLPWAKNVALVGYGHLDILAAEEVARAIEAEVGRQL